MTVSRAGAGIVGVLDVRQMPAVHAEVRSAFCAVKGSATASQSPMEFAQVGLPYEMLFFLRDRRTARAALLFHRSGTAH